MTFEGGSTHYSESMENYICFLCSLPIQDQLVFRVDHNYFHSLCLKCSECHIKLLECCYIRDRKIYCKKDFFQKFGTKCSSCGYNIPSTDIVQRANEFIYHLQCFSCTLCHCQLNTGDEFYLISDHKLLCKNDYDALKNKEFDETNKRLRTTITQNQLDVLKQAYNTSSKPARYIRESLAAETGLDMRVVQVWFQNRRAKEKRLKKDINSRWSNKIHQQQKQRRINNQHLNRDEETSNECDITMPYDDLSEHDSNDSINFQGRYPSFNQLLTSNTSYTKSNEIIRVID